jgi:hypothetical protein
LSDDSARGGLRYGKMRAYVFDARSLGMNSIFSRVGFVQDQLVERRFGKFRKYSFYRFQLPEPLSLVKLHAAYSRRHLW